MRLTAQDFGFEEGKDERFTELRNLVDAASDKARYSLSIHDDLEPYLSTNEEIKKWKELIAELGVEIISEGVTNPQKFKAQNLDLLDDDEEFEEENLGEESEKDMITKEEIIEWFWKHKNPSDEEVHEWAETINVEYEKLEEKIYEIVTEYVEELKEEEEGEGGEEGVEFPEDAEKTEISAQWYD